MILKSECKLLKLAEVVTSEYFNWKNVLPTFSQKTASCNTARKMASTRRQRTYLFGECFNSGINRIHRLPGEENERISHQEEEHNNHQLVIFNYLKGKWQMLMHNFLEG